MIIFRTLAEIPVLGALLYNKQQNFGSNDISIWYAIFYVTTYDGVLSDPISFQEDIA